MFIQFLWTRNCFAAWPADAAVPPDVEYPLAAIVSVLLRGFGTGASLRKTDAASDKWRPELVSALLGPGIGGREEVLDKGLELPGLLCDLVIFSRLGFRTRTSFRKTDAATDEWRTKLVRTFLSFCLNFCVRSHQSNCRGDEEDDSDHGEAGCLYWRLIRGRSLYLRPR